MIALTATVRPVESVHALPMLGQNLRRHYEHTLLFTDQMFVMFPGIGHVLVTEKCGRFQFDIVADDQATADQRVARLEADVRRQPGGQLLRFEWGRSAHVPVPFR